MYKCVNCFSKACNIPAFSIARIGSPESGFEKERKHQFFSVLMKKKCLYLKITVMAVAEIVRGYNYGTRVPRHDSLLADLLVGRHSWY